MKIGIICADIDEVTPIIKEMTVTSVIEKAMLKIHEGTLWGIDTVALFCGACKVNAAVATQLVIDNYGVDAVINVGAAGGIDPEGKVDEIFIAILHYDIQMVSVLLFQLGKTEVSS